jgi:hypothetical protein
LDPAARVENAPCAITLLNHHRFGDVHAVDLARLTEVVAQQIDDYQVLGKTLQLFARRLVALVQASVRAAPI